MKYHPFVAESFCKVGVDDEMQTYFEGNEVETNQKRSLNKPAGGEG